MALKDYGQAKGDFVFEGKGISGILQRFGQQAIDTMKANLRKHDVDPGNLYQAIILEPIEVMRTQYTMKITMPDYAMYVDRGVKGWQQIPAGASQSPYQFKKNTPPIPSGPLYRWAYKKRGLYSTRPSRKGKGINSQAALRSFVWFMQRSIKRKGLRARPFFTDTITNDFKSDLENALAGSMRQDIIVTFMQFSD